MKLGHGVRRRTLLWSAGGLAVLAAGSVTAVALAQRSENTEAVASTTPVRRGTVTVTVSAAGAAQPLQSRALNFSMAGTVTELDVKAGDAVAAGAVLARIDSTDAAKAVDAAQANVDSAQGAVDQATKASSATACPAPAAYVVPAPSASTSQGPAPSAAPSVSGSPPATRRPSPSAAGRSPCATAGGRAAGGDSLLAAQQQLNNARLALRQAQARLAGTVITAPIAGKVLSVSGVLGSQVAAGGSAFIVLAGTNDVAIRAQFTEAEVAALAVGQPAKITLPNRPGEEFTGTVLQIDPAGTLSNRLVRYAALIVFQTVPDGLLYGQSANVAVITASASDVLYVPATAVTDRQGSTGVVTVRAGGKDERRTVAIGLRGDVDVEIRSGVSEGEEVLSAGR